MCALPYGESAAYDTRLCEKAKLFSVSHTLLHQNILENDIIILLVIVLAESLHRLYEHADELVVG